MIEDNTHTDDFKRKTHCANVGIRQKLIVRILEFYKNSVSKFLENKKLNVLDMGYTLMICIFPYFCPYEIIVRAKIRESFI